ncbi:MAG: autoinducer binding domain-containing protein [Proteobacteria bacterium]|nr:autoinducer binding domain-containing protein [Pseudomonadota bacterium]
MILEEKIKEVQWLAPAGLQVSLRIRFGSALNCINTYPSEWILKYTELGFMMRDPTVEWAYASTGTCRWSTFSDADTHGVLKLAASYGIHFGTTISCRSENTDGHRTIASFGRQDREFEDAELAHLYRFIQNLHDAVAPPVNLTNAEIEALLLLKRGLIIKEVAEELNISENAVKQRMSNARRKLDAKTTIHAASLAQQYGLI